MIFDLVKNIEICFTYRSEAPLTLIYYSHISTAIVAIIIGLFVFIKNRHSLLNKLLLVLSFSFALWSMLDFIIWNWGYNSILTMVAWSLLPITTGIIAVASFYFFYVFLFKKDLSFIWKGLLIIPLLLIIFLTPTIYNLPHFDLINCEATENIYFTTYYYAIGGLMMLGILLLLVFGWKKSDNVSKIERVLMATGLELFLLLFLSLGFISSYLDNYSIEFYGLFGVVIFMAFLSYLIVRYKAFNIKLVGTQALVWTSVILLGSQLSFVKTDINKTLTIITLVFFSIVGWLIIRSVKKEIRQKEEIEHLLKIKSEFIDIVSHQLRTPVSVIKGMASMLKEGDLDNAPKEQRDQFVAGIYEKSEKLADILNDILKAAELDMDNFTFTPASIKSVSLQQLVKGIFDDLTSLAQAKKLNYQIKISPEVSNLNVMTDESFLKHVFQNVTDNAIKYSKEGGSMTVDLGKEKDFFICKITDSGIGIPEDQKDRLFEKFFRAKNAVDAHAYGTGLGLFITRKIVEAHPGGKIWFDSIVNKGTTFYIKLPIAKVA
jgi:signal transduction histidine kinase